MKFSPDGRLLATGANDRSLFLWSVGTGQVARILAGNDRLEKHLEFSPDGEVLATIGLAGPITIWDVDSGKDLLEIPVPFSFVTDLTFAPDGQALMVSGSRRIQDGESERFVSGVAFYSAGDPLLCGETFRYHVP
jgi:WD40 repeat protein